MRVPGWLLGYIACALLQLLAIAFHGDWIRFATKPMLMLILLFAGSRWWINAAIFFSWLGDIFLLGEGQQYFLAGLGAFLLAHVCYLVFFYRWRKNRQPVPAWNTYAIAGMGLYVGIFYFFLAPHLEAVLKIPVFVYACVIATMFVFSCFTNRACTTGAAFFLLSDSLLAINSFVQPFAAAPLLIMATYAAAQALIVWGCLSQNKSYVTN